MTVAHTLKALADRLEHRDAARGFTGSSIWGELSIIAYRTVSHPAVHAIEAAHPDWKEWTPEEAIAAIRALADDPAVEDAALAAAHKALEDARWALGKALGIDPVGSSYGLSAMIWEVADRIERARREGQKTGGAEKAPAVIRRPKAPSPVVVDVPLPDMP